jgi:hypothetical protein
MDGRRQEKNVLKAFEWPILRQTDRWVPAAVAALLALAAAWATLPFGSVTAWARTLLQVTAFAAFAVAVLAANSSRGLRHTALPAGALAGLALLGLLQAARLPAGLVELVSPAHARWQREAAELLAATPRHALSLAREVSVASALQWAAVAAALAAAALVGVKRRRRRWIALALVAAALFQVLYGTRRWMAGADAIWGVDVPGAAGPGSRLRGTFVNPNHLAAFLEIVLPLVFAWAWLAWRRVRRQGLAEWLVVGAALPTLLWPALFAGLAFTGSRAGLAGGLVAVVLQGLLVAAAARRWRLAPLGALAATVGLGVVAAVGLQQGLGRFLGTSAYEVTWGARAGAYAATLELWRLFPWTGTGLGTFAEAFPLVQPAAVEGLWRHAHSDVLEVLATTGVLGAAVAAVGLGGLLLRLRRVTVWGYRSEDRAAGLAALGVVASLAVHESLDFALTLPAVAFAAAVVLGAAAAAESLPPAAAEPLPAPDRRRGARARRGGAPARGRGASGPRPPRRPSAAPS